MDDFEEVYASDLEEELREIRGALFDDTIRALGPDEPISVRDSVSVKDVIGQMTAARRPAVLVVDEQGRLSGIFTERDVLTRVAAAEVDPATTAVSTVMTRDPDALSIGDRVAYAVHQMSVAGYRTIPLVDADRRPVGVVTVNHFIRWMASLFPEAVLNLRPGDVLKRPSEVDAG